MPTPNTEGVPNLETLCTVVQPFSHFYCPICSIHSGCCLFSISVSVCIPWRKSIDPTFTCTALSSRFLHRDFDSDRIWAWSFSQDFLSPKFSKGIFRRPQALFIESCYTSGVHGNDAGLPTAVFVAWQFHQAILIIGPPRHLSKCSAVCKLSSLRMLI